MKIDKNTLKKAVELMQKVKKQIDDDIIKDHNPKIIGFKAKNHPGTIASVDGSNYSLQGGSFVFSLLRSGIHYYETGLIKNKEISQTKIEILTKENYMDRHKEYFKNITEENPRGKIDFEKATERIRTLLEWDKIKHLVNELGDGDIILFDGSMISGVISTNKTYFETLANKAKEKGIVLAGLSKDSTMTKKNAPLSKLFLKHADKNKIEGNWYTHFKEEDTYFVKFRRHLDLIFRLDLVLPDDVSDKDVISYIGSYCFDAGIQGYPYPLQTIHDDVRISAQQFEDTLDTFKFECVKEGLPLDFINELLEIYHDQLDVISSGR